MDTFLGGDTFWWAVQWDLLVLVIFLTWTYRSFVYYSGTEEQREIRAIPLDTCMRGIRCYFHCRTGLVCFTVVISPLNSCNSFCQNPPALTRNHIEILRLGLNQECFFDVFCLLRAWILPWRASPEMWSHHPLSDTTKAVTGPSDLPTNHWTTFINSWKSWTETRTPRHNLTTVHKWAESFCCAKTDVQHDSTGEGTWLWYKCPVPL